MHLTLKCTKCSAREGTPPTLTPPDPPRRVQGLPIRVMQDSYETLNCFYQNDTISFRKEEAEASNVRCHVDACSCAATEAQINKMTQSRCSVPTLDSLWFSSVPQKASEIRQAAQTQRSLSVIPGMPNNPTTGAGMWKGFKRPQCPEHDCRNTPEPAKIHSFALLFGSFLRQKCKRFIVIFLTFCFPNN